MGKALDEKGKIIFTNSYILMALALISCFLWGSAFPSVKLGYNLFSIGPDDTFEKITFAGYRFLLSSIMIFVFCLTTGRSLKLKKGQAKKVIFLGLVQTSIQYVFFYIGLSKISGTIGSILTASNTFFAVILAHFFFNQDKLTFKRISGVLIGFAGVIVANLVGAGLKVNFTFTGEGFVIISSLMNALASIYTKKISKDITPFALSAYQLFFGSLVLIFAGWAGGGGSISFTTKGTFLLLYMGFISAAAFTLWSILLKYNDVGRVSVYQFTIPIFGTLLSFIILNERFLGFNVIFATVLVSLGIFIINSKSSKIRS